MTLNYKKITTYIAKPSVLLMGLVLSAQAWANPADDLKTKLITMNSFQAQFTQQVRDEQGTVLQAGAGNIALAQPMKIRWQQTDPDDTLFVSDGIKTYYYDTFSEQVTVMKTSGLIDTTPFILLTTRDEAKWSKYQIEKTSVGYDITPNIGVESQVEVLSIEFAKDNNLKVVSVKDVSGQVSRFEFKDQQMNTALAPSLFTFTVPEGVLIDDQTQGE